MSQSKNQAQISKGLSQLAGRLRDIKQVPVLIPMGLSGSVFEIFQPSFQLSQVREIQ